MYIYHNILHNRRTFMISKKYSSMLNNTSIIREFAQYASKRAAEIGAENVFNYTIGNPSVPTTDDFNKGLIDLIQNEDSLALHGYSPTLTIYSVRKAVAESLNRRFGMEYVPEDIFMTSGAAGALAHAIRCVTEPGDEVITFAPYFPEYVPYVDGTGAVLKVVPADITSFQINFDAFLEMMNPNVQAILINSPNNPSGIVYSTETITHLAQILTEKQEEYGHDIYLISDEPYREIVFEGTDSPFISKFYDNTICCYSFSKSLSLPGERIGYVVVPNEVENADQVIDGMEAEIPQAMYDVRMDELVNDFAFRMEQQGLRLEDYLKYMGQSVDQFRASFMPQAEKQVKIRLALEAVAAAENIVASEEDVDAEIKRIADQYKMEEKQVRDVVNMDDLKNDLAVTKAIDFIKSHANIVEKAAEAEKAADAE